MQPVYLKPGLFKGFFSGTCTSTPVSALGSGPPLCPLAAFSSSHFIPAFRLQPRFSLLFSLFATLPIPRALKALTLTLTSTQKASKATAGVFRHSGCKTNSLLLLLNSPTKPTKSLGTLVLLFSLCFRCVYYFIYIFLSRLKPHVHSHYAFSVLAPQPTQYVFSCYVFYNDYFIFFFLCRTFSSLINTYLSLSASG